MKEFRGIYAVLCTPFTNDDTIDEAALRNQLRYLVDEGGLHGVIPTGSTGEFAALTEDERKTVAEITIDEVNGAIPVVVGTAAVSTKKTIEYSQMAQRAGADGVMVVAPYYCHPNEEEMFCHFRSLAQNIDIPLILYNNPGTSGVDMQPELVARLAEFDNVDYIKESSGDMTRLTEIMRLCGDKIKVFCGCDTLTMEMFIIGAVGWVAPAANIIPAQCVRLFELAAEQKDLAKAKELYFKLLPLFGMFENTGQYVQLTKTGLGMLGRSFGKPRKPLLPPTEEVQNQLKKILDSILG